MTRALQLRTPGSVMPARVHVRPTTAGSRSLVAAFAGIAATIAPLLGVLGAGCRSGGPPLREPIQPLIVPPTNPTAVQLRGRVLDPLGKPLAGVPVLVMGGGHTGERPITNAAGEFSVAGLPTTAGGYVAVHVPGFAVFVREPVRIAEHTPESVTVRLEPERVLAGRLLDDRGAPLARARVVLRGDRRLSTPLRRGASWEQVLGLDAETTDADGRFRFRGLYAGNFEVEGHWPGAADLVTRAKIRSGGDECELRFDPAALGQVVFVGRVLENGTQVPLGGVEVEASALDTGIADDDPDAGLDEHAVVNATTWTAPDGAFALGPFAPAHFTLSAASEPTGPASFEPWHRRGAFEPGVHRIEIELARKPD